MEDPDRPTDDLVPQVRAEDCACIPTAATGEEPPISKRSPGYTGGLERQEAHGGLVSGKYRILGMLGAGGMGRVYRVRHEGLGKEFALKLLKTGAESKESLRQRFESEARALGRLDHPNILAVTDYGLDETHGGAPYLVTEILQGRSLGEALRGDGPLDLHEALPLFRAVASALDYAHGKGLLHRDIKPDNVFLCEDGGVKLLDFGLAKLEPALAFASAAEAAATPQGEPAAEETDAAPDAPTAEWGPNATASQVPRPPDSGERRYGLTEAGSVVGTPGYVAPEVLRGAEATRASDIYSLGVLLHRTLSGQLPRFARGGALAQGGPLPLSGAGTGLPRELDRPVSDALDPSPERRPATALVLVDDIERAAAKAERRRWAERAYPRRAIAALALAGGFGLAAWLGADTGPVAWLEGKLYDLRVSLAPARAPDPRLHLLLIDRSGSGGEGKRILERGPEIGETAGELIRSGAAAVVVDVIAPPEFRAVRPFQESVVRYGGDRLFLAAASAGPGDLSGRDCLAPLTEAALMANPERWKRLFAYATVLQDPDGKIRRVRTAFRDRTGELHPTVGAAAAAPLGPIPPLSEEALWMDGRLAASEVPRSFWGDRTDLARSRAGEFRGKVVIIGATSRYAGEDQAALAQPGTLRATIPGAALQALMASTLLDRARRPGDAGEVLALLFLLGAGVCAFLLLTAGRTWPALLGWASWLLLYALLGYVLLALLGKVLLLGWPLAAGAAAGAGALGIRRLLGPVPSGRAPLAPPGRPGTERGGRP
jgi:serine/threonine protein kinase/CHASE2 domain-containing sensor protein